MAQIRHFFAERRLRGFNGTPFSGSSLSTSQSYPSGWETSPTVLPHPKPALSQHPQHPFAGTRANSRPDGDASAIPQSESRTTGWRGHIPALDGVRGLAIVLVIVCHAFSGARGTQFFDSAVIEAARAGWIGVDLFFVLSGFLITGILVDSRDRRHYFRNFYVRRALRIFPLYYGLLVVAFVALPLLPSVQQADWFVGIEPHRWWFWTYSSNILLAREGSWDVTPIFGGFWSLAVEEQFYLVWPAIVLLVPPARLRRLCVAIIVGAFLFRISIRSGTMSPLAAYALLPARADALAAGAWIALALRTGINLAYLQRVARRIFPAATTVVFLIYVRERAFSDSAFIVQTVGYSCLAFTFGGMLCLSLDTARGPTLVARAFRTKTLRSLGKYSYAMYCFDPLVMTGMRRLGLTPEIFPMIGGSLVPRYLAFSAVMIGMILVAAMLSWHLYEVHFLRLKDRFADRNRAPPTRTVPVPA